MTALLYGVVAAIGWGFADYMAALLARRVGTYRALLGVQLSSFPVIVAALALTGNLPPLNTETLVAALALGFVGSIAIAALYKGLALGPMSIVSPIAAAYAAVTVLLAVTLLGETLSPLQVVAMAAVIGGVALASTDLRVVRETLGRPTPGVTLGLLSMIGFGITGLLLATYARSFGAFAMLLLGRAGSLALLLGFGLARRAELRLLPARTLTFAMVVGLLDIIATAAFGLGAVTGYASIVAIGSTAYPLIPLALGLTVQRERVAPNQLVGVGLLLVGLVVIGGSS
jgi:drug/metabolite transporter (DMT)-like permease